MSIDSSMETRNMKEDLKFAGIMAHGDQLAAFTGVQGTPLWLVVLWGSHLLFYRQI